MTTGFISGPPGPRAAVPMNHKSVILGGFCDFLPGGGRIDTAKTRDITNTVSPSLLNPGLLMGIVTANKRWANSIIGLTQGAIAAGATTLTLTVAAATELVRRIGASGTFKLIGPPGASGIVRIITVTYSAVNLGTGVVTMTAVSANMVQRIDLLPAATGGNIRLLVPKTDGSSVVTANAAWNATDATFLGAINTQLDASTGVVGGIVASAIPATDTDLGFLLTFSGAGYAGLTWPQVTVQTLPTSSTAASYSVPTAPVNGAFVTNSIVAQADGSETPKAFIFDGYGITMGLDVSNLPTYAEWPDIPVSGKVMTAQLINWPADPSLREWIMAALSTYSGGKFVFDAAYQ